MLKRYFVAIGTMAMLIVLAYAGSTVLGSQSVESTIVTAAPLPAGARSHRSDMPRLAPTFSPTPAATETPTPTATATPTTPPTATPRPPLPGAGPHMPGELIAQTSRYDVYVGINSLAASDVLALLPQVDQALDSAEERLGTRLQSRPSVGIFQPARRPIRGVRALAFTSEQRIELYYGAYEDPTGMVRVLVHELGHQLEATRYGDAVQQRADIILHEGLATWLADTCWLERSGGSTWPQRARTLRSQGRLLPIRRDPSGAAANDAYEGWAAFVDYLINTYGWDAFDDLYRSSSGRYPGSADYRLVYGADLDALVADWYAFLAAHD